MCKKACIKRVRRQGRRHGTLFILRENGSPQRLSVCFCDAFSARSCRLSRCMQTVQRDLPCFYTLATRARTNSTPVYTPSSIVPFVFYINVYFVKIFVPMSAKHTIVTNSFCNLITNHTVAILFSLQPAVNLYNTLFIRRRSATFELIYEQNNVVKLN